MPGMTSLTRPPVLYAGAASMRPRLNAGDDILFAELKMFVRSASMRPRLNAGDDLNRGFPPHQIG